MKILRHNNKSETVEIELTEFEFATINLALMVGQENEKFRETFRDLAEKIDKETTKDVFMSLAKAIDPTFSQWVRKIEKIAKKSGLKNENPES